MGGGAGVLMRCPRPTPEWRCRDFHRIHVLAGVVHDRCGLATAHVMPPLTRAHPRPSYSTELTAGRDMVRAPSDSVRPPEVVVLIRLRASAYLDKYHADGRYV